MEKTGIIWTEKTWNPFRARHKDTGKKGWFCTKVNQGCKHCYAETLNLKWGNGLTFTIPNLSKVEFYLAAQNDPFKWKEPSLIFVNSMTDFWLPEIPIEHKHTILDIMESTPWHEYQVLTKRPELMYEFSLTRRLPKNFWAGVSIPDDKARQSGALDYLHKTKAEMKFISAEPIIGPIHFSVDDLYSSMPYPDDPEDDYTGTPSLIDWIITGGESGSHLWDPAIAKDRALVYYVNRKGANITTEKGWYPRPDRIDWIRDIRDICAQLAISFFHKQWGGHYPEAAGRTLDGKTYNEIPRLPGNKTFINNDYLKKIEKEAGNDYGKTGKLF